MLRMVINQSVLLGVKPICVLVTKYLFSSEIYVFTVLGTISDERLDLSFIRCLSLSVIHIYIFK
jgi:hypothetical protein